jgi:hypothetical protein
VADRELIVEFKPGVSEDEARDVALDAGAKVRRRMKSDPDKVLLLIKIDAAAFAGTEKKIAGHRLVVRTEHNDPNFEAM